MKGRNGKDVKVGAKAVLLKSAAKELAGRPGTIRAVSLGSPLFRGRPAVRISDGEPLEDDKAHWSAWAEPKDVAVVE